MAKRNPNFEYLDEKGTKGLWIKLYAPEGSVFRMPPGGDPINYVAKGYKLHPDAEWRAKNEEYEAKQAESLKVSNWEGEIKVREAKLKVDQEKARLAAERKRIEAEIAAAEEALKNPAPEPVAEPEPAPAKAKGKGK